MKKKDLGQLFELLKIKPKKVYLIIITFLILAVCLDAIGVSMIIPVLSFLSSDQISNNFFISILKKFILIENTYQAASISIIILLIVSVIKLSISFIASWYINKFSFNFEAEICRKLYVQTIKKKYLEIIDDKNYKIMQSFIIDSSILSFNVILPIIRIISELLVIIVLTTILFYHTFKVTIVISPIFFLTIFLYYFVIKNKILLWGKKREEIDGHRIKKIKETFDAIKEIKISKLENLFIKKFTNYSFELAKYHKLQNTFLDFPKIFLEFISILFFSIFILLSSNKVGDDNNSVVLIGLTVGIMLKILPSINRIIVGFQLLKFGLPVVERIYNGIFANKEYSNFNFEKNKIDKDFKKIIVKNISYKFSNQKNQILKNINLEFNNKDIIGLCGSSGSGKSTFLNIFLGLINQNDGDIFVDQIKVQSLYKQYLGKIFYLPQNIFIFEDTIEENIILNRDLDHETNQNEQFYKILKISDLEDLISKMPKKEKTIIGEAGKNISGGQRQKIGIARALYNNPQILILDEFTNALDKPTQLKIIENLKNISNIKLVILVSHDQSVFEICNRKLKIENKTILEIK